MFFCISIAHGESGPYILGTPNKYAEHPDGRILDNSVIDADEKSAWIVCSDRDNNSTYTSASGTSLFKVMGYLEKFYVSEEKDKYLHLYKYEENLKEGGAVLRLKATAQDYGWVQKSKLLLWLRCIETKQQISTKALLTQKAANTNNFSATDTIILLKPLSIYANPELSSKPVAGLSMIPVLFVYKVEANSLLLGKTYASNFHSIVEDIIGWISKDNVQIWDGRFCLVTKVGKDATNERVIENNAPFFFNDTSEAAAWKKGILKKGDTEDNSRNQKNRYPVLNTENGLIHTGYFSNITNNKGKEIFTREQFTTLSKNADNLISDLHKINILFVMDMSNPMIDYANTLTGFIKNVDSINSSNNRDFRISYGAVAFKDYSDTKCKEDCGLNVSGLSPDPAELISFINGQKKTILLKNQNRSVDGALLKSFRMLRENQANIIFLFAGSGIKLNKKYPDTLFSNAVARLKTDLVVFKSIREKNTGFDDFGEQYKNILKSCSEKSYSIIAGKIVSGFDFPKPRCVTIGNNCFSTDFPATSSMMGYFLSAKKGGTLSGNTMQKKMDSLLLLKEKQINKATAIFRANSNGQGITNVTQDAALIDYYMRIGEVTGDQGLVYKFADTNTKYQYFIPSYTVEIADRSNGPLFKKTLFLSNDELDELKYKLKKTIMSGTAQYIRGKIKETYQNLLASYIGDKMAREAIEKNKYTPAQVIGFITGIPVKNALLHSHAITEYEKPKKVKDDELYELQYYIEKKYEEISSLVGDPAAMQRSDAGIFYWVPEEFLP